MAEYLTPDEVDSLLKLPHGRSARLAKRGLLPAVILPDRSIRFNADELQHFLSTRKRGDNASK